MWNAEQPWHDWRMGSTGKMYGEAILACLKICGFTHVKVKMESRYHKGYKNALVVVKHCENFIDVNKACCYMCAFYAVGGGGD